MRAREADSDRAPVHWEGIKDYYTRQASVTMAEVIGQEAAKEAFQEKVVLPLCFPQLFKGVCEGASKAILLHGPPGSGKSFLSNAVAAQAKAQPITCNAGHIARTAYRFDWRKCVALQSFACVHFFALSSLLGHSHSPYIRDATSVARPRVLTLARALGCLFSMAVKEAPTVLIFRGMDELMAVGAGHSAHACKAEFVLGLRKVSMEKNVIVIALATEPWRCDDYVHLFDHTIALDLPTATDRAQMIQQFLGKAPNSITEEQNRALAHASEGFTVADVKKAVKSALMEPVRRIVAATHFKQVSAPDRENAAVMRHDYLTPCSPKDTEAIEMSLDSVADHSRVLEQPVTFEDLEQAFHGSSPSVPPEYFRKVAVWQAELATRNR